MKLRRLVSFLLICSLALGVILPGSVKADTTPNLPADYDQAVKVLSYFKLVAGDAGGYRPFDTLTRAEAAKLAVAGMAMADQQAYYQNNSYYQDVAGHWAKGYINLARQVSIMRGYPDGQFRPDATVSYAEAIAIMDGVGGVSPAGGDWPNNWVQAAQDAGIVTSAASYLANLNAPAQRADVFVMLYRALTQVKDFSGMSLLQRRFKPMPPTITVDSLPLSTTDLNVTISGTVDAAEAVTVNGNAATLQGNHFSVAIPLVIGVNSVAVSARDLAGNTNVVQQQILRENTDAAAIVVTGPHTVGAGQSVHLSVVVQDTNGAPLANVNNLIVAVPAALGYFDPYSGTFQASQSPATGVMTVSIGSAKTTWSMTVGAGAVVQLQISPDKPLVKKGKEQTFTLTGVDQYSNPVDVSGLTVTWQADGGVINQQGVFAATTSGTAKVTAIVGDQTVSTQAIVYGAAAKIGLTSPGNMTANNADTVKVPIEVQDADGHLVPDYQGSVYVQSTVPNVANTMASTVPITDGKGTATLQAGRLPGTTTLVVTADQLASGSTTVTVDAQQLGSLVLSTDPTTLNADGVTKQTLTVTAVDAHGKPMLSPLNPPLTVHLVSSSAAGIVFDSTGGNTIDVGVGAIDPGSGTARTSVVIRAGTVEATANIAGLVASPTNYAAVPVRSLPVRTVHVGSANKLSFDSVQATTAGTTVPLYVRVLDQNGNQVSNASLQNVVLTLQDQTGKAYPATVGLVAGHGRAEFDVLLYKAATYTFTATATVSGSNSTTMLPASQSLVVNAGAAVNLSLSAQPGLLRADGGTSRTTITAAVQDAYGNVVPAGSYTVSFQRLQSTGATGTLPTPTSQATQQGVARLIVPSGSGVGTDVFTAATNGLTTQNSVSVSAAIMGVPTRLALRYGDNNGDGTVNGPGDNVSSVSTPVTVYVDLMDNQSPGYVTTYENGEIITLTVKNLTTGDQQVYTAPIQSGTATFTIVRSQATTYSLLAKMPGLTSVGSIGLGGTIPDLVLRSGSGAALVVTTDFTTIKANPGKSYATLSVSLVDAAGNPTINTGQTPINVTLKASSTTYGNFTQDNTPTGTPTDTFTVAIQPNATTSATVNWYSTAQFGPTTIAASSNGFGTGTTVITSRLVGVPAGIQVQSIADTVVQPYVNDHGSVLGQDVKVTAVDAQGYQVTDYGVGGETITLSAPGGNVISAYYNYTSGSWVSLDQAPAGQNTAYPSTYSVPAYKGQAWFRVRSAAAGSYTYTASLPMVPPQPPITQTATGRFVAGPLTRLNLIAAPSYTINGGVINPVAGGGKLITVTAQFVDQYGNVLTNQVGTVYFQLSSSQYGTLLSSNAIAQNGTASAVFQSTSTTPLPNGTFQITAYTSATQPGGAPLTNGSQANPASITVTEDSIAPTVQTVAIAPGGTADQKVTPGDYITVNFSKTVNASGIFSSLTPGTTLATGLSNLRVFFNQGTNSDTITFGGGLTLGTITLQGDSMSGLNGQSSVAYGVSSLSMSADGTQVTVVLGSPQGSGTSPVGLTLSSDPTKSTFAPSTSLTDLAGNAMVGTPVNLNANSGF